MPLTVHASLRAVFAPSHASNQGQDIEDQGQEQQQHQQKQTDHHLPLSFHNNNLHINPFFAPPLPPSLASSTLKSSSGTCSSISTTSSNTHGSIRKIHHSKPPTILTRELFEETNNNITSSGTTTNRYYHQPHNAPHPMSSVSPISPSPSSLHTNTIATSVAAATKVISTTSTSFYSGVKLAPPVVSAFVEHFERRASDQQKAWYTIVVQPADLLVPGAPLSEAIKRKPYLIYRRYEDVAEFADQLEDEFPSLRPKAIAESLLSSSSSSNGFNSSSSISYSASSSSTSTSAASSAAAAEATLPSTSLVPVSQAPSSESPPSFSSPDLVQLPRLKANLVLFVTKAVCADRKQELDQYFAELFQTGHLGPLMAQSRLVAEFFGIWKTDMEMHLQSDDEDPLALNSKGLLKSVQENEMEDAEGVENEEGEEEEVEEDVEEDVEENDDQRVEQAEDVEPSQQFQHHQQQQHQQEEEKEDDDNENEEEEEQQQSQQFLQPPHPSSHSQHQWARSLSVDSCASASRSLSGSSSASSLSSMSSVESLKEDQRLQQQQHALEQAEADLERQQRENAKVEAFTAAAAAHTRSRAASIASNHAKSTSPWSFFHLGQSPLTPPLPMAEGSNELTYNWTEAMSRDNSSSGTGAHGQVFGGDVGYSGYGHHGHGGDRASFDAAAFLASRPVQEQHSSLSTMSSATGRMVKKFKSLQNIKSHLRSIDHSHSSTNNTFTANLTLPQQQQQQQHHHQQHLLDSAPQSALETTSMFSLPARLRKGSTTADSSVPPMLPQQQQLHLQPQQQQHQQQQGRPKAMHRAKTVVFRPEKSLQPIQVIPPWNRIASANSSPMPVTPNGVNTIKDPLAAAGAALASTHGADSLLSPMDMMSPSDSNSASHPRSNSLTHSRTMPHVALAADGGMHIDTSALAVTTATIAASSSSSAAADAYLSPQTATSTTFSASALSALNTAMTNVSVDSVTVSTSLPSPVSATGALPAVVAPWNRSHQGSENSTHLNSLIKVSGQAALGSTAASTTTAATLMTTSLSTSALIPPPEMPHLVHQHHHHNQHPEATLGSLMPVLCPTAVPRRTSPPSGSRSPVLVTRNRSIHGANGGSSNGNNAKSGSNRNPISILRKPAKYANNTLTMMLMNPRAGVGMTHSLSAPSGFGQAYTSMATTTTTTSIRGNTKQQQKQQQKQYQYQQQQHYYQQQQMQRIPRRESAGSLNNPQFLSIDTDVKTIRRKESMTSILDQAALHAAATDVALAAMTNGTGSNNSNNGGSNSRRGSHHTISGHHHPSATTFKVIVNADTIVALQLDAIVQPSSPTVEAENLSILESSEEEVKHQQQSRDPAVVMSLAELKDRIMHKVLKSNILLPDTFQLMWVPSVANTTTRPPSPVPSPPSFASLPPVPPPSSASLASALANVLSSKKSSQHAASASTSASLAPVPVLIQSDEALHKAILASPQRITLKCV